MRIIPKEGIDKLLFGMNQKEVEAIYGKPSRQFKDEDKNIIQLYNQQKWRLTFYEDEAFRLGYIICAHPDATLFEKVIVGRKFFDVKEELILQNVKSWEQEDFDLTENHFNEENWLILQSEFDAIIKVEIGALIVDDEFNWPFGNK